MYTYIIRVSKCWQAGINSSKQMGEIHFGEVRAILLMCLLETGVYGALVGIRNGVGDVHLLGHHYEFAAVLDNSKSYIPNVSRNSWHPGLAVC